MRLNKTLFTGISFSSCGPTMDGRIKHDVVAPGVNILSALNSYYPYDENEIAYETEAFGRKYSIFANNGTSMATPFVSGIIALWLQAKPDLTPEDILELTTSDGKVELPALPQGVYAVQIGKLGSTLIRLQ